MPVADVTARVRAIAQEADLLANRKRFVDMGVRLYVVEQDTENGVEVFGGLAPVSCVGQHEFGGMLDTRTRQFTGPSINPQVWYCSPPQLPLILHDTEKSRVLVYGAMGAGKSRGALAPWLLLRSLEFTGIRGTIEIGGTAPTDKRLSVLHEALCEKMPSDWYTYLAGERLFLLANGTRIRLAATKEYSAELGSPIQGWNWAAAGS